MTLHFSLRGVAVRPYKMNGVGIVVFLYAEGEF